MRKLATAAFSFSAAVFISHYLLSHNLLPIYAAVAVACSFTVLLYSGNKRLRILIILISLAVGFIWSFTYTLVFVKPHWDLHEETATIEAVVTDYPVARNPRGYLVDVSVYREGSSDVGGRLYYYTEAKLKPGDNIVVTAKMRRTDITDEGERYDILSSRGIYISGSVTGEIRVTSTESGIRYVPKSLANSVADKIKEVFKVDVSHFLMALLIGKRDELYHDSTLYASLSASGIIHVVSISGMHISFLMGFLALVIRNKRLLALYGIPVLVLFMAMTGFTPAITRAGIMQIFLINAPLFKRESDSITSLSAAMLLLLIINPYSCASAGLQLSFFATLGIILFTGKINNVAINLLQNMSVRRYGSTQLISLGVRENQSKSATEWFRKIREAVRNYITSSLSTTIGAIIFTLPLTAIHFGYISLIAPITNVLTIGVVSLIFPVGMIAALLGFLYPIPAKLLAFPVETACRYVMMIARVLSSVPYSVIYSTNASIMYWVAYVYVLFISMPIFKARPRQYLIPVCISIILLFSTILTSLFLPNTENNTLTVLDVGQGMSVVVTSNDQVMIVDCGSISKKNAGEIAHEFLTNIGCTSLDILALTHYHEDHINGVEFLLSRINVSTLVVTDPEGSFRAEDIIDLARKRGSDIIYVTTTHHLMLGELEVTIFPPLGSEDENERGLSVLTTGAITALITGDMGASIERILLRYADLPKLDVLVVGHHGSRFSTSEELLGVTRPDIAIVPVGRNSFGHPNPDTLERLKQAGAAIYRADEIGHVTVVGE